jgi:hypothetical protein
MSVRSPFVTFLNERQFLRKMNLLESAEQMKMTFEKCTLLKAGVSRLPVHTHVHKCCPVGSLVRFGLALVASLYG